MKLTRWIAAVATLVILIVAIAVIFQINREPGNQNAGENTNITENTKNTGEADQNGNTENTGGADQNSENSENTDTENGEADVTAEGSDSSNDGPKIPLKIMTYNMHHAVGVDEKLDLSRIKDVIAESGAEIIGLQEVDKHFHERSEFVDQAKWLAEELDMHVAFGANLDRDPLTPDAPRRQYGTAVLSKYPIIKSENYHLSSFGQEQRGILETEIDVNGVTVYFYSTHFGLSVEQRTAQAAETIEIVEKRSGPRIIVGDLNAKFFSEELKEILSTYQDPYAGSWSGYTFPANMPNVRADYILSSKDDITFITKEVIKTMASDHLPVVAEIEITVEKEADASDSDAGE